MATLVLTAAVSSFGFTGFTAFAANLAATAIGTFIDNRFFGPGDTSQNIQQEGPRLSEISLSTSSEGQPIKRLYGRTRLGGNLIWVTNFKETVQTTTTTQQTGGGGKGGGGGSSTVTTTTTEYLYSISCAFAFCEGSSRVTLGRIWADGRLLETSEFTFRFYPGSDIQAKDSKISAVEGSAEVPAFRGISYLVFEDLPLQEFGNRIPQITAEIIKPLTETDTDILENLIEGVNIIPSAGEVAYGTTIQLKDDGFGNSVAENVHLKANEANFQLSIDEMVTLMPNNAGSQLVIAWFGTDLRLSECKTEPRVEVSQNKVLEPINWNVGGLTRSQVNEVSKVDERPAFGGTPSDHSIVEAIQYLCNEKEQNVYFYPFMLMDIPAGNTLPDPYDSGNPGQSVYPWRGRITTSLPSVDGTAAAQTEINAFFGSVSTGNFSVNGTTVTYTGSASDFGFRRMILHYAHLCAAIANTLDDPTKFKGFYVGTEMRGVTRTRRDGTGVYPGVMAFSTLIDDVSSIFNAAGRSNVQISYAADWSEYHSHRPDDGSGDVFFNMDEIWSNANCDYVAIDNYMPISDWRDGTGHLDYGTGNDVYGNPKGTTIYSEDYLKGQIEGGEYYDYFYASDADRTSQNRSEISDDAHSEPWVFRNKDIRNWWSNAHHNRPGGTRSGTPTSWTAGSKKIVFSEYGSPAVDKGTNQPNVFFDPKSSESFLPYFSNGIRDDQIQRAYYEMMITYWRDNAPTIGAVKMIDPTDMFAWTWDARPYPAFPFRTDIWTDGDNWALGHWLNGRVGVVPLGELVKLICAWVGFADNEIDVTGLVGSNTIVRGYVVDNIMSPREALNPLFSAYLFDGWESGDLLKFQLRANTGFTTINSDEFVTRNENPSGYKLTRAQETELPQASRVSYIDEAIEFQVGSTGAEKQTGASVQTVELRFPIVLPADVVRVISEIIIQESWVAREKLELELPPSRVGMDPADGITTTLGGRTLNFRVTEINRGSHLEIKAETIESSIYDALVTGAAGALMGTVTVYGKTVLHFMDLPLVTGEESRPWAPRLAAYQGPFPPAVNVFEEVGSDLLLRSQITQPTQMGILAADLQAGPHTIIDEGSIIQVDWNDFNYQLTSDTEINVRAGANALAIRTSAGEWEIIKFINSAFQSGRRWNLSRLIRGQLGSYAIMEDPIPAGQPVVLLDSQSFGVLALDEESKNFALSYRYGPSAYQTGSPFFQSTSHTGRATGQIPYPVAHIEFDRGTGVISWVRQTRFGGDGLEQPEVPLNEDNERYEIDIFTTGDVLLLSASVTTPSYTYAGAPASFKVIVYQMSTSVGRGRPSEATFGA